MSQDRDLLAGLNEEQARAVTLPPESALVLAGAGSGKTRVLTTRVAWLLAQGLAQPWQIMAVTFTNKAAGEMRQRLARLAPAASGDMWVGTFHALCHRMLRYHAETAGLPKGFQIIDNEDQLSLVRRLLKERGLDPANEDPKGIRSRLNKFKESGLRAEDISASEEPPSQLGLYRDYQRLCQRDGLVDFAELLLRATELLERDATVSAEYRQRFRFVLIDEFQDSNALQFRWLRALAPPGGGQAVFCVGDDDQSIYGFRGARVSNMHDFLTEYRVPHLIRLERNYRSTRHILAAANAVIAHNKNRLGKNLWTALRGGDRIQLRRCLDENDEARAVADELASAHAAGEDWRECAILYRNNAQSRAIEQVLTGRSIPYRVRGGTRFYERQEVRDLVAYLRLLSTLDDLSFLRAIQRPPRGIGATTVERLTRRAAERGLTIWSVFHEWDGDPDSVRRARPFVELIEGWRRDLLDLPLPELIEEVIERSGLAAHYQAQRDQAVRLENMAEVVSDARRFYEESELAPDRPARGDGDGSPLDDFLARTALDDVGQGGDAGGDAVQLMTVHSAKGLEFDRVWLSGLEDGLFPYHTRFAQSEEDEERRLMYVAMTRARKQLCLSWCRLRMIYGQTQRGQPSRFLAEIPPEHLDEQASEALLASGKEGSAAGSSARPAWGYQRWFDRPTATRTGADRRPSFQRASERSSSHWGLSVGDRVRHHKFGDGVILSLANADRPDLTTARVRFELAGTRELMLALARLVRLET